MRDSVALVVPGHDERAFLHRSLRCGLEQSYPGVRVYYLDNGSRDGSANFVRRTFGPEGTLLRSERNLGCSGGRNYALAKTDEPFYLSCDANAFLGPEYVAATLDLLLRDPGLGMAQGKILALPDLDFPLPTSPLIDTTGLELLLDRRNRDRGQGLPAEGHFEETSEPFGVSGCAPLYRRSMLRDAAIVGEVFDEDMFIYREEVDLAWRCRLLAVRAVNTPWPTAWHLRTYAPRTRRSLPGRLRRLQYRNRYLMILKNDDPLEVLRHCGPLLRFELPALSYLLAREPEVLSAWPELLGLVPRMLRKRGLIHARRRLSPAQSRNLFSPR